MLPNNLILFSFFGFLFSQKCLDLVWNDTRLHPTLPSPLDLDSYIWQFILSVNVIISWFVLSPASVGEIAEYAAAHQQRLEDSGKPADQFTYTFCMAMNEFSQSFFFFFLRRLSSLNCSFIVYYKRSSVFRQLPSVDMSVPNRHAHVRIGLIVRHIRNAYQKRLSEKLTYFIATLLDIRTSFCALIRRQTVTMA